MNRLYSLPCKRRVWLFVFVLSQFLAMGQIGGIYQPSSGTILDPNSDGWISASGGAIDTSVVVDESFDFEYPMIPMFHLSAEPPADLQGGNDCGKSEIVDNPNYPMSAGYWYMGDANGIPGDGDEFVMYRIRIARNVNGAYGFSFLIDTDNRMGFTGATADPNAVSGNPGFEIEVIYGTSGSGLVSINDVDGTTSGTMMSSYPGSSHSQRSHAGYTNCPLSTSPVFLDFYIPFDSLGISPTDTIRMIFATATSPNSALGGSASDIGGVNDNLFSDGDSIFVAITDSTPSFTFGGCGWAIAQQGSQVSCHGDSDGWAWVDVWGGSPPVTYLWSTGSTNDTVYNLTGGTYEVYVTSGGGCMDTVTVDVYEPDLLVANAEVVDSILCYGDLNGTIAGFATGGTPPYTTSWDIGALSDTVSNLGAGSYTYYVTDSEGCTDSVVIELTQPASPVTVAIQNQNEILCYGDSIGSLDILITGGTPPYTVLWEDGSTDSVRANLVSGTYSVVVTDANGCTDSLTTTLTQPAQPVGGLTIAESPVSCFGGADGVGVVVATGGRSPYTYLWSNGETTDTATALTAGNHTVIITDSVGCIDTLNLTITQPDSALTVNAVLDFAVPCFGGSDGQVTAQVNGGTLPYSFIWNTGDTTSTITGPAGSYSVVVTDGRGCSDSATVVITQPASALVVSITDSTNVLCFGDADGSASATASGGTAPYDFEWSNGVTDSVNTGLSGGTYTVIVTDANGCRDSAQVTISEPTAALDADANIIQAILCNGDTDGSGYASVSGGTAPYTFLWSNGSVNDTLSNLSAGTYTVTVTDANGCIDTASFVLAEPAVINLSASVDANVLCFGDNTGEATVTVTGGVSPYTYAWSSGQTTANVTDLYAGNHTVVVTDANGCSDSIDVVITEPASVLVAGTSSNIGVTCKGDVDGSATATASGGTPPYTYSWSNGMTGASISGLAGGDYILTVTDANGCQDVDTVNIFEPAFELLVGAADGTTITCNGASDGTAYASASGGVPPYTYSWSNGMTGDTITGIPAGSYVVTVTDSMGCTDTNTVVVVDPPLLELNVTHTDITCFGLLDGTASSNPAGGESPYVYLWSNGSTSQTITGLSSGTYWVQVTDNLGCTQTDTIEITSPSMPLAAIIVKQDVNCFGGADGTATANGSGGVIPYTYLWSDGQTGQTATGLAPGSYHVIMTDANGCQDSAFVTINQPAAALVASGTVTVSPTCGNSNGEAYVTATGGTAPYTYNWSNGTANDTVTGLGGGSVVVTITDANGCIARDTVDVPQPAPDLVVSSVVVNSVSCNGGSDGSMYATASGGTAPYTFSWSTGATGDTITGLAAGSYTVYVLDSNGCSSSATFNVGEPDSVLATTSVIQNVSCFGGADGSASAAGSGGNSPYTYTWDNGQTTATSTGLTAGIHTVTVTDANGCVYIDSVEITQPATAVDVSAIMASAVSCFGGSDGSATATGSGGTPPYTYAWANGQTTATATGLAAGSHLVTVTDSLGCTDTVSVVITQPASAVDVALENMRPVSCVGDMDGWATVTGSGGTSPYTYSWSSGHTGDSAWALAAGNYTVVVTDANGCTDSTVVTITEPATPLSGNAIDALTISCFGGSDGTAYATASGGWSPYTFSWSTGDSGDTITGLSIGTYTVTITDSLGCQVSVDVTLTQPTQVAGTATLISNVLCLGGADGSAHVVASGGTSPYTYAWGNGETNDTAVALSAGTHTVTITDANGCTATAQVTIGEPATAVSGGASVLTHVLCFGDSTATARATASGGTAPYTYAWSNGQTTRTATGLWSGIHTVVVTDANGCIDSAQVTVTEPATAVDASAVMTQQVSCYGGNDGMASASATGGTAPYTFTWSNGVTGSTTNTLSSQWYVVTVADANGCTDTARVFIQQPTAPVAINAVVVANVTCFGGADGQAWANVTGGTPPYTYSWSDGQTGDTAVGLVAGNYAVLVTDSLGCQDLVSVVITQPASDILATAFPYQTTSCYDGADGSAYVQVTNGVPPFTYLWSDGQTNDTATGLSAQSYTVTVTDALGCDATATVVVASPPQNIILTPTVLNNVSCIGGADASAHVFAQGGTPPYTYAWSNGDVTATATGFAVGTHSVVVTDSLGCSDSTTVTFTEPASAVDADAWVLFEVNCKGGSDGYASASATGGTPPYTFIWDNGQTGTSAYGLDTGLYVVTVIDANGCQDTAHVMMTEPDSSITIGVTIDNNVRCLFGADGSATANATGGTPPYYFDWDHGVSTATASGLMAGTYRVTVTDDNGCQDTMSITITQPATALALTAVELSPVNCFGGADGIAVATATGGDAPYTYAWSNGFTGDTASGFAAGSYNVTVTDSNGCQVTVMVTITQPASAVSVAASVNSNVSCFGGADGSATAVGSGGTPPYTYAWSNGQITPSALNLAAGSYTVWVTDANGCVDSATVVITQPASALSGSTSLINPVSCYGGSDANAYITYSGGTSPYTVLWSNGSTMDSIYNVSAGTYTVTVTDANGCLYTDSVVVTQPSMALDASATVNAHVLCYAGMNGAATASANGGTPPYTYAWSNGANTPSITSLGAGQYVVTITDANGCVDSDSVIIQAPLVALDVNIVSRTHVDCFGNNTGSAQVLASGGTAPYTYSWSNGASGVSATALAAGSYVVTVTDANGCTDTTVVNINQPASALTSNSTIVSHVNCFGGNDGQAYVTYTGGTASYTVAWSNGASTDTVSNLVAGTYTVTVTDANGCTTSESVTILQPSSALSMTASVVSNVNCFGGNDGAASATATGGTAPYTYTWSNGANSAAINNITAGSYTVVVTDANGCTDSASVVITQPASALSVSIVSSTNVSCFGGSNGSAQASATGGTAPYTYSWSNGANGISINTLFAGTYVVTVTDANGCVDTASVNITQPASALTSSSGILANVNCYGNADGEAYVAYTGGTSPYTVVWSNGASSDTISGLAAGTYTATITDANGCTTTESITILQPTGALNVAASVVSHVNCFAGTDGAASVTVSGGTAPYVYSWSNGAGSAAINSLSAGTYIVTVTDANGCSGTDTVVINQPASALTVTAGVLNHVTCFNGANGSAAATPAGGTAPYTYNWSNGSTTNTASNLAAGTYTVTVTDANGCTVQGQVVVTEPSASITVTTTSTSNVSCNGNVDGAVTVSVTGGTAPYTYAWSNGGNTAALTGLAAGTYTLTVTDANGCAENHTVTITEPAAIVLTRGAVGDVMCFGNNDGFAGLTASGGAAPYTITWSNGGTGATQSNLAAGTYTATVTDANGCSDTLIFIIHQPTNGLSSSIGFGQNVTCYNGTNGEAFVSVTGGTAPYSVVWSNGTNSDTISGVPAGTYSAIITDANGCTDSASVVISQPSAAVNAALTVTQHVYCKGEYEGRITSQVTGGTPPYTYSWSNGATTDSISGLAAGTYTLTVTDNLGCTSTFSATVTEPARELAAVALELNPVNCFGESDGKAMVQVTGGTAPYTINWSTGYTGDTLQGLAPGRYQVVIHDANGCFKTDSVDINGPDQELNATTSTVMVNCGGANSGELNVAPFGGTPPYVVRWNHGPVGQNINNLPVGIYSYIIEDASGCQFEDTLEVTENEPIESDIYVQFASCPNTADGYVELTSIGGTPPYTYFFDGKEFSGIKNDIRAGSHEVVISDAVGCDSTFYIYMGVDEDAEYLHIPNAFTPNEDRINEDYKIFGSKCIGPSRFQIFDRWGNLVFSSHKPFEEFWDGTRGDGTLCKEDVYVWVFTSDRIEQKGHVVVIH